jgi:protein-disulfide isomerase
MYEKLFVTQDEWSEGTANRTELFKKYATEVGLNMTQYEKDLNEKAAKYAEIINTDARDASAMGIMATPTLIINGKTVIRGAVSFDDLKKILDKELQGGATSTNEN